MEHEKKDVKPQFVVGDSQNPNGFFIPVDRVLNQGASEKVFGKISPTGRLIQAERKLDYTDDVWPDDVRPNSTNSSGSTNPLRVKSPVFSKNSSNSRAAVAITPDFTGLTK